MAHDSVGMAGMLVVSVVQHAPTCGMAHEVDRRGARSGFKATVSFVSWLFKFQYNPENAAT
jgi:hypothetical protein